ncbi:MAG: stage II sporulation protein M [Candidatus Nanoarchaeia archaeon]|nr:stage II sporulation protein M [Candidatus Nanoarchaeia archaeon]
MVLEDLLTPEGAERKPWHMLPLGALYASIAVFLALWIFREQASLIVVFLTVMACIPLIYKIIKFEEDKEVKIEKETGILKEHKKALVSFIYLFFGFVIAFSIWFIALPASFVQDLFATQMFTISSINNAVTANVITGHAAGLGLLWSIIANNLKVLFFCVFFSFFYGSGMIFILTWNASVIASAIGSFVRSNVERAAAHEGLMKIALYSHMYAIGMTRYMTHGVFEILAYFIGGLAGGLISIAIIKHRMGEKIFNKVMLDALDLILLAIAVTLFAGIIEVYVTPLIV